MQQNYDISEWESRAQFMRLLEDVCAGLAIDVSWLSDGWIVRLQKNNTTRYISGYTFPLNDAAASDCMRDKITTYTLLNDAGIPAIPHYLLRLSAQRDVPPLQKVLALAPLPLVIKPAAAESGGFDVVRCTTEQEVSSALPALASRHRSLAVCPYIELRREIRVVVLDGKPLVAFEKIRQGNEWRHNLKTGAQPRLIAGNSEAELLAVRALGAVQGRVASVDIAETPDGYKIMELNSGITLDRFSMASAEYRDIAVAIYRQIIGKSLAT